MNNLKHVEWHGGTSAHRADPHQRPTQRELVAASLLRRSGAAPRRWDERTQVEYPGRGR